MRPHVAFSFHWVAPQTIEHDMIDSSMDIIVYGTGDANEVCGHQCPLGSNYYKVGLILMEILVGVSKQTSDWQTHALVFKMKFSENNRASRLSGFLLHKNPSMLYGSYVPYITFWWVI